MPDPQPEPDSDILAGPLNRPLLRLALPMLGAYLCQIGFNWVDTYFVASLGESALAAVGASMFVTWLLISVAELATVGTLSLVARAIGARKPDDAGAAALGGVALTLGIALGLAAGGWWLADLAASAMRLEPEPAALCVSYLRVLLWGFPTLAGFFVLEAVFRGAGHTVPPMVVLWATLVLNGVLDYVLIFGLGPIPAMGVTGAALATVISRGLGCLVLGLILWRRLDGLKLGRPRWRDALHPKLLRRIARIGAPVSAAGSTFCLIYMALTGVTTELGGTTAVAALGLGIRLEVVTYMVALSLGRAAATVAGQNLGAGNLPRAHAAARRATLLGSGAMLPLMVPLLLWPEVFLEVFTDEPAVIEAASSYLRAVALVLVPMTFEVVLDNVAGGVGDTVPAMLIEVIGTVARIPLALGLAATFGLGYVAVWWAIAGTAAAKGLAFEVWFRSGRWKRATT
jgi:MATE family, multidrug efflux pump